MEKIKFSIIMPTYNRKHCIKDAIDSLFVQTYQNFELIIIDDGSTDGTEEYLKEIYKKEIEQEQIRYIKLSENIGASSARNEGLKIAKNEWIAYLDSDNKMYKNFLETYAVSILENKEYKVFYAKIKHRNSGIVVGHEFIKEELESGNFIDMGVFVHHIDLFKEFGGFDPEIKKLDDWYLILKYTAQHNPFFIDQVLLDYYDGEGFSRMTTNETHDDNYKRAVLGYLKSLPDNVFLKKNQEKYERFKIIKEKELILKNQEEKINKNELELKNKDEIINQREKQIKEIELRIKEKDGIISKNELELKNKNEIISQKDIQLNAILNSTIWKITKPMRKISDKIKRLIALIKYSLVVLKNEGIFSLIKRTMRFFYKIDIYIFRFFKKILPESIKSKIRPFIIKFNNKYKKSILNTELSKEELEKQKNFKFDHSPLISIIVPTYNTPKNLLFNMIKSVIDQTYSNWELCIADGSNNKEIKNILREYSKKDNRIKIIFLDKNEGISINSNQAINISTGEYIAFLDHDDILAPFALYEVVSVLNTNNSIDVIYSDEDKILSNGEDRFCSFFKPDWSPEFLRGTMYVGHFLVVKKSLAIEVGLLNSKFDKIQDYEFMLRLSEKTNNIHHISKILYHWRSVSGSIASNSQAKGNIDNLQENAVNNHLKRIGLNAFAKNNGIPHRLNIYPIEKKIYPLVSIIIPTKDNGDVLDNCLKSIFNKTNYQNYEVILVDNNTTEKKAIEVMKKYPVKIIKYNNEFNFSEINNIGAKDANGEYLIFLNNDTEIVEGDWIKNMLYYAEQKDVGAVGPMLLYLDNTIQHAGVVLGFRGTADHVMRDFPNGGDGYFGSLCCAREVSAVTAACIMLKKSIFEEIEGFNQHYNIIYQDVDLCLKIRNKNYRIIYTPLAKLIHHESKSRGGDYNYLDRLLLLDLWENVIKKGDPYYNINFDLNKYSKGHTGYNL